MGVDIGKVKKNDSSVHEKTPKADAPSVIMRRLYSSVYVFKHSLQPLIDTAQRFYPDMLQPLPGSTIQIFRSFIQKLFHFL
jgi:hypothetical protein